ncbi:YceI family protein [Ornithobacterium rhinotracheale]|uniref:YceI family protein n=1 Tax=Ornithobacterium rhinotracheale TaxID=28251 RepID=UPI00129CD5FA|nr:YceI family protein [Ornithobacterium rhinotracheale]MRI62761.1 YceI family protein [Ornithobacterium rhinotracheale]MRJ08174.1 YceI family protein [Ornithobacterium rhinotracheale]MRJ09816.1 YceI family protein [Ornithobacterium rhinotracheale]UOH77372.1 YceI family protein [Ornithobacterium rhinotracheale]
MKNSNLKAVLFSLMFIAFGALLNAQALKTSRIQIQLNGTSTIHDWQMNAYHGDFSGVAKGDIIENVKFVMKAEDLQSNRKGMDANAYKALNTNQYPNITFTANQLRSGIVKGQLTINNVTKNIELPVVIKRTRGFYTVQAEKDLLMTDFNVTPPTFYNSIKTANEVKIAINLILKEA